jgi:hypothetical protein
MDHTIVHFEIPADNPERTIPSGQLSSTASSSVGRSRSGPPAEPKVQATPDGQNDPRTPKLRLSGRTGSAQSTVVPA